MTTLQNYYYAKLTHFVLERKLFKKYFHEVCKYRYLGESLLWERWRFRFLKMSWKNRLKILNGATRSRNRRRTDNRLSDLSFFENVRLWNQLLNIRLCSNCTVYHMTRNLTNIYMQTCIDPSDETFGKWSSEIERLSDKHQKRQPILCCCMT